MISGRREPLRFAIYYSLAVGIVVLFFTLVNIGISLKGYTSDDRWWLPVVIALGIAIYHLVHAWAYQKREPWSLYTGVGGFMAEAVVMSPLVLNTDGWRWLAPLVAVIVAAIVLSLVAAWQLVVNSALFRKRK